MLTYQNQPDYSLAIAKAMYDVNYKSQLKSNPHQALQLVGYEAPKNLTIFVHEKGEHFNENSNELHLVIPSTQDLQINDAEIGIVAEFDNVANFNNCGSCQGCCPSC